MKRIAFAQLVELVGGDLELVTMTIREEIIAEDEQGFAIRDVDRVLTARTLVRELEIDWSGVGLILQLREQLAEARRELAIAKLREPRERPDKNER